MEYYTDFNNSEKYIDLYGLRKIRCENEYLEYRSNYIISEWYLGEMRHHRRHPASIHYIGEHIFSLEWYTLGYKGNTYNDILSVTYYTDGKPMTIYLKGGKEKPISIQFYKNGGINSICYHNGYDTSRKDGMEFVFLYEDGTIAYISYSNRLDYLIALEVQNGITYYHYSDFHPQGLKLISIAGDRITYKYS